MFMVLIKYEDDGEVTWEMANEPFKTEAAAMKEARRLAEDASNTFAVVEIKRMVRRTVTEIVEEVSA